MAVKKKKGNGLFGIITADLILNNMGYVFFWVLLILFYIANTHYSEKKIREIQVVQGKLKKLKWEYTAIQSDVMYRSKQSDIVKSLREQKIDLKRQNPKKVLVHVIK